MQEKYSPLPREDTKRGRQLNLEPAYREAINLLQQNLVLTTPRGERMELGIAEVEPFDSMLTPGDESAFDSMGREYGDVLILWRRGHPQLNIVVDPRKKSIVCIKKVILDGQAVSFRTVLEELLKRDGKKRIDLKKIRIYAKGLDGLNVDNPLKEDDPEIIIKSSPRTEISTIREATERKVAENSLGVFVNISRIQGETHDRAMGAGAIE